MDGEIYPPFVRAVTFTNCGKEKRILHWRDVIRYVSRIRSVNKGFFFEGSIRFLRISFFFFCPIHDRRSLLRIKFFAFFSQIYRICDVFK